MYDRTMDVNVTRLQELLYDIYKNYNLSLAFSASSCSAFEVDLHRNSEDHTADDDVSTQKGNGIITDTLGFVAGLFNFNSEQNTPASQENGSQKTECISLFSFNVNQKFSTYCNVSVILVLSCFLIWTIFHMFKCLYQKVISKRQKIKKEVNRDDKKESNVNENIIKSEISNAPCGQIRKNSNEKLVNAPIRITFPARQKNVKGIDGRLGVQSSQNKMDGIFDSTLSLFLKRLECYLGIEIPPFTHQSYTSPASSYPLPSTVNSDMPLQSPRVRRKWSRPQDISPSILLNNHANEKNLRNWMMYEMLCKKMNWSQSKYLLESFIFERNIEKDETLNMFLKFLRENYVNTLVEWNVSVSIVNYSLFVLDQVLNIVDVTDKSNQILQFARFESIGSAANGTVVGKADHFDVMFVIDFNKSTDLVLLQNNYCDEISPGHVVIGVKDVDGKNISQTNNCLYKGQVKDTFGYFLLCNQIENIVDGMVRKAVNKLNVGHKYKMERLPFKLKMNGANGMKLIVDTNPLNGMGLGLSSICIRFIPAICIESSEFLLLPKLYAVPSWRADHRKNWEEKDKRVGALTKLFLRDASPRIPSNLFWNLSVFELETKVKESIEDRFYESSPQNCYQECLMILKALFSSKNKNMLLSRGEISSYVLSTVVNFLFMESPSSAWKMSQLPDRVSDAVHFLRSSYINVWLPNFIIHNPHLIKKIPVLSRLSSLVVGRQQNLLADVDADSALKTVAFIDSRLKETGLAKVIKAEYSEEMWEYEFFLFG